jgi:hypothetical protein
VAAETIIFQDRPDIAAKIHLRRGRRREFGNIDFRRMKPQTHRE